MQRCIRVVLSVAALTAGAPVALADDVSMEQLPDPVRETVQREAGDAQILEIERDREPSGTVYEVEVLQEGRKFEIDIADDGRLLQRHED
jgi:hypothetical protein